MDNTIDLLCCVGDTLLDNPHLKASWRTKVHLLRETGHHIVYSGGGGHYRFQEYDEFTFTNDKDDQALARAMVNLDYDIEVLKMR